MKGNQFADSQILVILKAAEGGVAMAKWCRQHGTRQVSFYKSRAKFSGMHVLLMRRMKALEDEIRRLKHMCAQYIDVSRSAQGSREKSCSAARAARLGSRVRPPTAKPLCGWPARPF